MSDTDKDTDINIDHYSIDDLLTIFNLDEPTEFQVKDVANTLIAKMKTEGKPNLVTFFTEALEKVLKGLDPLKTTALKSKDINDDYDSINKIWNKTSLDTDNVPAVYFDDGTHIVADTSLKPLQLQVNSAPIIATHIINIDSQFRTNITPYSSSPFSNSFNTNFTFNLSSPINKAISIQLYSYHIPTSWYAFTANTGNTFLIYNGIVINIPDGNYTPQELTNTINIIALKNSASSKLEVNYNTLTNRISFTNNDTLSASVSVVFYIQKNVKTLNYCSNPASLNNLQTIGISNTLGWLLGFRTTADAVTGDVILVIPKGETAIAEASPDTYGPKYFILSVEDYSNSRLTSGSYSITNTKIYSNLTVPEFFATKNIDCKLREGSLTQAQIYTINALKTENEPKNNYIGFNNKSSGATYSAAFATIPLSDIRALRPDPYIKFGGDLTANKRNYSSPTILLRFTVSLHDDKKNLVNLYDNDWSFSLIVEERLN